MRNTLMPILVMVAVATVAVPIVAVPIVAWPRVAVADEKTSGDTVAKITPGPPDPSERDKPGKIDADAPQEFKTTDSGLKYRILRKSTKRKPTASNRVDRSLQRLVG